MVDNVTAVINNLSLLGSAVLSFWSRSFHRLGNFVWCCSIKLTFAPRNKETERINTIFIIPNQFVDTFNTLDFFFLSEYLLRGTALIHFRRRFNSIFNRIHFALFDKKIVAKKSSISYPTEIVFAEIVWNCVSTARHSIWLFCESKLTRN